MSLNQKFPVIMLSSLAILIALVGMQVNGEDATEASQQPTPKNNTKSCSAEIGKKLIIYFTHSSHKFVKSIGKFSSQLLRNLIALASSKTGSCPAPSDNIRCFLCNDSCKSDAECNDQKKCCPQPGCGNGCKDPISQ